MKQQENKLKEDLIKVELEHKRYIQMERECTAKINQKIEDSKKYRAELAACREERERYNKLCNEQLERKKSYDMLKEERDRLLAENQRYRKKYVEKGVKRRCEKCDTVLAYVKK